MTARFLFVLVLTCAASRGEDAYVGSQACSSCHAGISASYAATPMRQSSGTVGTGMVQEGFLRSSFSDKNGGFAYAVSRNKSQYVLKMRSKGGAAPVDAVRHLSYFAGSGAAARSYLISVDGFLYEAPVAWYAASDSWNFAPGYSEYSYPYLTRAIPPACLQCHASGVRQLPGTQNGYETPPFREGGVGCESCHGPGSAHVTRMRAGTIADGSGFGIINPAKLDPERRNSVCAQCHLTGDVRVAPAGQEKRTFVPGETLANNVSVFVRESGEIRRKVTSHVENLAQSLCKRSSGEKMWCGTCHDPHSVPGPDQKAEYYRGKCLTCHAVSECKGAQAARTSISDNCISCHMPRNPVGDAAHVVYTDHSIRRLPSANNSAPVASAPLVLFSGGAASDRDLGLAYAIVALRERNPVYSERAFELLKSATAAGAQDSQTLSYLAELYKNRADDAHAAPLYEQVRRTDPDDSGAAVALGGFQMEQGHYDEAIRLWNEALAKSPALVLVRANLALALIRTGRMAEARQTLEKALDFNPAFTAARELLDQIMRAPAGSPTK